MSEKPKFLRFGDLQVIVSSRCLSMRQGQVVVQTARPGTVGQARAFFEGRDSTRQIESLFNQHRAGAITQGELEKAVFKVIEEGLSNEAALESLICA